MRLGIYDTDDLSVRYIKNCFFGVQKNNYVNGIQGTYTINFGKAYKDAPFVKFKNGNNYFLQFSNSLVGGKFFFYGSNLFIKGIDKELRIKDLKIVANNCNLYLDLSEGVYGVPSNIFCSTLYIIGYPNDLNDFYKMHLFLADISLIRSNVIYMDKELFDIVNRINSLDDVIYKIDMSHINITNQDLEQSSDSKVLKKRYKTLNNN